jgi:hypothetical protein
MAWLLSSRPGGRGCGPRGGGAAHAAAREAMVGLTAACPGQPVAAPSRPGASVVMLGWPALVTEVHVPAKEGATVVTLLHREQSRGAAMHH